MKCQRMFALTISLTLLMGLLSACEPWTASEAYAVEVRK